jgi:Flp pilus assembly protein TadG
MTRYRDHRSQRNRRGIEVLELVLVLPILFLTLIAGIQFATTLVVNNTISAAVHEASRLAAMGCDESEISDAVDQFLAAHNLSLGVGTRLVIDNSSSTLFDLGDGSLTSPTVGSAVPANSVRATLLVATDVTPIPNLLANYCVDFEGKQYELCSIAHVLDCSCN